MTINDIDTKISELRQQRRALCEKHILEVQEAAKVNIGRCFIVNGEMCKVLAVPQKVQTMTEVTFNEYQYPAVFISKDSEDFVPFYTDTVFSGGWGDGYSREKYTEISPEEFDKAFVEKIIAFQHSVFNRKWEDKWGNLCCPVCSFECGDEYYLGDELACPNCGAALHPVE